jgi:dinuclear metal center YbgI/SA1388 family protein
MRKASLSTLVRYCDRLLRKRRIGDWDQAHNGLQVENRGKVTRIAATVDATPATVGKAVEARADFLIVHHGLFWSPKHPWTGKNHQLLRLLIDNDLAVYSSHLPLDMHPALGNNALLCAALKLKNLRPFFFEKGQYIGFRTAAAIPRETLSERLNEVLGRPPILLPGGPEKCRQIGVVTGGAGNDLKTAADEGVDTFITGEGLHWTYAAAEEMGINVFYGGHYATETFGVKALAGHLSKKFDLPWTFIDHPTGL